MEILREARLQANNKVLIISSVSTREEYDEDDAPTDYTIPNPLEKMIMTMGRMMPGRGIGPGCTEGQCLMMLLSGDAATTVDHDGDDYQVGRPGSSKFTTAAAQSSSPHSALSYTTSCCHHNDYISTASPSATEDEYHSAFYNANINSCTPNIGSRPFEMPTTTIKLTKRPKRQILSF